MEKIVLTKENRRKLIAKYGDANVSRALNFRSNSFMSREIRHIAINELNGCTI
jgi:hypothetical protein